MIAPLTQEALQQALASLPDWTYDEPRKAIHRRIVLRDFGQALGLMVRIGVEAEKRDHHPEWANVYNKLDIWLTTHDADGVSTRDVELAGVIDRLI
ncbi:4a-hydroxytetrahydrobiopterin dehydratase [Novosphingobium terrae]|uniref:4a-hydroxytetrahydrobiopterin dehydratase n=1 Tax=Novosphingobium terrae TaxID=2726189 RepID=UPI00197E33A3|nr:4a-hydroxytetrahydrobiopterin dehydratase [Novosphingobium terrae]